MVRQKDILLENKKKHENKNADLFIRFHFNFILSLLRHKVQCKILYKDFTILLQKRIKLKMHGWLVTKNKMRHPNIQIFKQEGATFCQMKSFGKNFRNAEVSDFRFLKGRSVENMF